MQYSCSCSIMMNLRSSFLATTPVVPEPEKGSSTMSPFFEEARITFASSFSGFWVGWGVFSGMDQKGIVMSVHIFDGWVCRNLPSLVSFQSLGLPSMRYGAIMLFLSFTDSTSKWYVSDLENWLEGRYKVVRGEGGKKK